MACLGVSATLHAANDAVHELQEKWRLARALEELKQLDQQYDANRRETDANHWREAQEVREAANRRKEAFLKEESAFKIFNGFKDEQQPMTPEKVEALRRQKQQRQQEARQRAQAKKRRWEETFGASSPSSSSASSCDIRLSHMFEHLVERLNKFVQTHSVYACATTLRLRAKIVSVSVHLPPTSSSTTSASAASSAISIWVQPPIELFEEPYCCSHTQGAIPSRLNLVEFMNIVSTTTTTRRRIYDEVQCSIEWRQTKRTDVRNGTDVRSGASLVPLATLIPTAILFATSSALVVQYTKYLDWLMEDPLVLTMFLSSEFRSLFTIPTAPTPSPVTASVSLMEIEVDEPEEVNVAPPIPNPPRTDMVEVVDEKTNCEDEKEEDVTRKEVVQVKEPKRKRQKREVLASARQLRPRRICTCHM